MPQTHSFKNAYRDMWEVFGKKKAERYNQRKFLPINRVGLTNFIREEALLRMVLSVEPKTVLDIGCASGRQVFALAPYCENVVGVDIAQSFIDECDRQRQAQGVDKVSFRVATFHDLPDESFDVVLCGEVFEHVPELDEAVNALTERLRNGGHAVVSVPHFNADGTWWGRLLRLVGARRFRPLEQFSMEEILSHGDAHIRAFSQSKLRELFESYGYRALEIRTVSHLDGPWSDVVLSGFLERMPWTRGPLVALEHVSLRVAPRLGRHIVLLAEKL